MHRAVTRSVYSGNSATTSSPERSLSRLAQPPRSGVAFTGEHSAYAGHQRVQSLALKTSEPLPSGERRVGVGGLDPSTYFSLAKVYTICIMRPMFVTFRQFLKIKRLSPEQWAVHHGYSHTAAYNYLRGRMPSDFLRFWRATEGKVDANSFHPFIKRRK